MPFSMDELTKKVVGKMESTRKKIKDYNQVKHLGTLEGFANLVAQRKAKAKTENYNAD